jgi:hypothetical protein
MVEEKKKNLSDEFEEKVDETIDDLELLTRKAANRFGEFIIKASMEKFDTILNSGKVILKEKVKKGIKHGKTQKRKRNKIPTN